MLRVAAVLEMPVLLRRVLRRWVLVRHRIGSILDRHRVILTTARGFPRETIRLNRNMNLQTKSMLNHHNLSPPRLVTRLDLPLLLYLDLQAHQSLRE